ncbi:MAG: cysteine dioxygenase family protein [Planctomycetota bacterium]|jgi:cysteine dioxygenase|nr:cysteine dioxygenase family protein [Planctomycetota bacterium]MDP6990809.1 cysteine dioxygenase family protein [Planctomycetota bacterium]
MDGTRTSAQAPLDRLCSALSANLATAGGPTSVASLLAEYASAEGDWRDCARFVESAYTRNLIYKDEHYELLALCWSAGQESPIHNHMGQRCWMGVLEGRVEEVQYDHPAGEGPLVEKGTRTFEPGQVAFISDEIGLHLVRPADGRPAVSLHLYARPFATCRGYDPATGAERELALSYHSVRS